MIIYAKNVDVLLAVSIDYSRADSAIGFLFLISSTALHSLLKL